MAGLGRGAAGVLAALLLVLIVTSSLATVMVLTGRSMEHGRATLEESARRARDTATPPALSLEATGGSLVATVISQSPTEVRWFVVERADGSVEVKPGGMVHGATRFTLSTSYDCQPVRVYMILASGAAVAYDPRNDPLVARIPEGWDGWWRCGLPNGEGGGNTWRMIDPSRVQPVKASGGGGNDTVEYNIPPVRANFVGNFREARDTRINRVHREAVPQLGGYVTVRLQGALSPPSVNEPGLLILRVEGPSDNIFFTGTVTAYVYVSAIVRCPPGWWVSQHGPFYRLNVYHVAYTPSGNATVLLARTNYYYYTNPERCWAVYEGRYRIDLVDSKAATMLFTHATTRITLDGTVLQIHDARYEVNVTITRAKVVNMKPTVFSLGSPGWVRLTLIGYVVNYANLNYTIVTGDPPIYPAVLAWRNYRLHPWVGAVWAGTSWSAYIGCFYGCNYPETHSYSYLYGGHPQVTAVLDAGRGLSKNFTLTPGQSITLAYPGEIKIVVTPKPDPPFNPPSMRASEPPIFAPWRAPAIILAEYADGRREVIVVSPTGHVTVSQGNLVFTGYGQLLGGLPFTYTPQGSRLAVYNGGIDGRVDGPGSWLSQPVLQVTNAYRVIAVIPDDRFRTGYVVVWVN